MIMAFCKYCGAEIDLDAEFCSSCEKNLRETEPIKSQVAAPVQNNSVELDSPTTNSQDDIQQNKGISILSYIGPLVFIPLIKKKDSPFAQFHAEQGFNVCCLVIVAIIINKLLSLIKVEKEFDLFYAEVVPAPVRLIMFAIDIFVGVFAVIGIINCVKGETKKLPLIGNLGLLSKARKIINKD